jgi:menaquinone-dependent protoporphyrinogen IX oxidase
MKMEYFHASEYGNGVKVAEEFKKQMDNKGITVNIHHIHDVSAKELPPADLYVFSSPGRLGKPIKGMRRFLEKVNLPPGTKYAILTTEAAPKPDRKTGRMPGDEEVDKYQHVRSIMNEVLQERGLVKVAEDKVWVMGIKGPLEADWQKKVEVFASRLPISP